MKVYKVKVNGKIYEVELEAVTESANAIKSEPLAEHKIVIGGSSNINAPIAGKVLSIKVNVGDNVKKGQTVAVIEAMKLENEVPATAEGKVVAIKSNVGASVNNGDVLIILG